MNICARAALLFSALSFATPTLAEDCSLKSLASLDMLPSADRILISASMNGTTMPVLVDTGGGFSSVSDKTADALNLTRQEAQVKTLDLYGNASRQFVRLDTIELGSLKGKNVNLMIFPGHDHSFDGLIAGDMLEHYDMELNFVTRKLNLFSQDHCEGKVIYWPATAGTVVPFSMSRPGGGHDTDIRIPVTLDGKHFQAIIDTGAPFTAMSADAAERAFGITAASPGAERSEDGQEFSYAFHSLSFEGIAMANPSVTILSDVVGTKDTDRLGSILQEDNRMDDTDLIVGMDVLKQLHVYIAYGEQKLYITPPDQPATPPTGH